MSKQARLDVVQRQSLAQERIRLQIDLPDGEVVRRAPVRIDLRKFRIRRHVFLGMSYTLQRFMCVGHLPCIELMGDA